MKNSADAVLDHMRLGRTYTVTELAQTIRCPLAEVRDTLCKLVEEGIVEMTSRSSRIMRFKRTGRLLSAQPLSPGVLPPPTSVATFPVTRNVSGVMVDYDLDQHRKLAMLARRSG